METVVFSKYVCEISFVGKSTSSCTAEFISMNINNLWLIVVIDNQQSIPQLRDTFSRQEDGY